MAFSHFLVVKMFDSRFAFASKIDYLCRRESIESAFPFFVPCGKEPCKKAQNAMLSASNHMTFCVKSAHNLTQNTKQNNAYCEIK